MSNFEMDFFKYIQDKSLGKLTTYIIVVMIVVVLLTLSALLFSTTGKLSDDTEYTISSISDKFIYTPHDENSPEILLKNFRLFDKYCTDYETQTIKEGQLKIPAKFSTSVYRVSSKIVRIHAVPLTSPDNKVNSVTSALITYQDQFEKEYKDCIAIDILLDDDNPRFTIAILGTLQIGEEVSDKQNEYHSLVREGSIKVTDTSFISSSLIMFQPYEFGLGDTVYIPSADNSPNRGIIEATLNTASLQGVFTKVGGEVSVRRIYSEHKKVITPNLIDRITNDSELAMLISFGAVLSTSLAFMISLLVKLNSTRKQVSKSEDNKELPIE